jgi:acetolactate synthase-1/3 small subunit
MTIVIDTEHANADRVVAYLYKLVNVRHVETLGDRAAIARDLALIKVASPVASMPVVLRIADETRAHIVDLGEHTMTVEITGEPPYVDAVIERLSPLGIVEMVRAGQVSMRRGDAPSAGNELTRWGAATMRWGQATTDDIRDGQALTSNICQVHGSPTSGSCDALAVSEACRVSWADPADS